MTPGQPFFTTSAREKIWNVDTYIERVFDSILGRLERQPFCPVCALNIARRHRGNSKLNKLESANIVKPSRSREICFLRSLFEFAVSVWEISIRDIDPLLCTRLSEPHDSGERGSYQRWLIIMHPPSPPRNLFYWSWEFDKWICEKKGKRFPSMEMAKTKPAIEIYFYKRVVANLFSAFVKNGNSQ